MGANTFTETWDNADVDQAFSEAVREARYMNGSGGYSGTLAEKGDYTIISRAPISKEQAYDLANDLIDKSDPRIDDKWGPAGAIAYADVETGPKTIRTQTVTITLTGDEISYEGAEKAARAKARLKADESITAVRAKGMGWNNSAVAHLPEPKFTYKVVAEAPKEKTETRFIVSGYRSAHASWETGFKTQAEARAYIVSALDHAPKSLDDMRYPSEYEIESVTRRTSGEPLVKVRREVKKVVMSVELEITHAKPVTRNPKVTGWLFFGWASS